MFREMRRKKQQLTEEACRKILKAGSSGVLAVLGDDDYPYAVPLNYVYENGRIYFHCAKDGHKLDAIKKHAKASFCVIYKDRVIPLEYRTDYQSVIAFGTIRILEDPQEKRAAVEALAFKYAPDDTEKNRTGAIEQDWKALCMLEMCIEHLTGKESL